MTISNALLIGLHALAAWVLIEIFVNHAHRLGRCAYIVWHYLIVIAAFAGGFMVYQRFFSIGASAFTVTVIGMGIVFILEFIVFRFLYSGERWFLNWVDWIFPIFLAASTIYAVINFW